MSTNITMHMRISMNIRMLGDFDNQDVHKSELYRRR